MHASIFNADGSIAATGFLPAVYYSYIVGPPTGVFMARTTVANGITDLQMTPSLGGAVAVPTVTVGGWYSSVIPSDPIAVFTPAVPNGKLVIVCHGHGGNPFNIYNSAQYGPIFQALMALGYTIAIPNLGGDLWGNAQVQALLADLYKNLCAEGGFDSRIFLLADSMGSAAALNAIAFGTFGPGNIAAAYLAEPVCDIDAVYTANGGAGGSFPEIHTLYPSGATAAGYNPIAQPASAFAGVPLLFLASPSDGTVSKTANTDAMRTRIGAATTTYLIAAVNGHTDLSEYQPDAAVALFQSAS